MAVARRPRRKDRLSRYAVVLSLRWYLLALTAALMLPLLILASVEVLDASRARRSEVQIQMRLLLSGAANGVEQGLDTVIATANLLALSPTLAAGDLTAFRQTADELAKSRKVDVLLRDPSGAQVVATRVPRDAPPPTLPPEDRQARAVLAANRPYVSDVYTSGMTHPFLTRVIVPAVLGSGKSAVPGYELEIAFTADVFSAWVNSGGLPKGWFISVLGRNGQVVAHSPNPDQYVGRGTATTMFGTLDGASGPWLGFDLDGKPVTGVYTPLPTGWVVLVGAPDQVLAQPTRTALLWLAAVATPLILGGLVCSLLLARRINGSVNSLGRTARALGEGQDITPVPLPVHELAFVQEALCTAGSDIAARRVTERTLLGDVQAGRDLLQGVVDGSSDLIFARDGENRLVLANQASAELFGFRSGAEAVGRTLDGVLPASAAALSGGDLGGVAAMDGRMFEVSHSALRDHDGVAIGTISIARDVTERVVADSRLQRLQSDLARAGRLSAVAAMGAGLAHELHQPLSAAANFLAVAKRRLAGSSADGPALEAMAEASAQVLRTGEIVKRLRGFIGEAEMQDVALAPLVREAAEAAWRHTGPTEARLNFQLDESLAALADPVSIQQVVSNLVRNAAEAVAGRGDVWVVLEPVADGSAMVSVLDSGAGIDAQAAERLFDVFGGSGKEGGLGVGLAICRTIVSAHGGWITAGNHAEGGAAFMFTLPPRPPALAAPTKHDQKAA
jgi:signal transduction histidine kinase